MDKPAGPTSHDAVAVVRRALGVRAVGHTGTLDPFATGLLVLLVGRATRLARFVAGHRKTYLATARIGVRTATDDLSGEILPALPGAGLEPDEAEIRAVLAGFAGTQRQRPPAFSAKRVGGVRSYRRARRGEAVELADADVTVHQVDLVTWQPPEATFRVTVSAGTYVRAMARDLGERLGTGAHLTALRREASGPWRVEAATPLARVDSQTPLRPMREIVSHLEGVELDAAGVEAVRHGRGVPDPVGPRGGAAPVALLHREDLVGVALAEGVWLKPMVVLVVP